MIAEGKVGWGDVAAVPEQRKYVLLLRQKANSIRPNSAMNEVSCNSYELRLT